MDVLFTELVHYLEGRGYTKSEAKEIANQLIWEISSVVEIRHVVAAYQADIFY